MDKTTTITVHINGSPHPFHVGERRTYGDLVALAGMSGHPSVIWRTAATKEQPRGDAGELDRFGALTLVDGMHIELAHTGLAWRRLKLAFRVWWIVLRGGAVAVNLTVRVPDGHGCIGVPRRDEKAARMRAALTSKDGNAHALYSGCTFLPPQPPND